MIEYRNCSSEKEKIELINDCETAFERQLECVSDKISSDENINYVTLSGPTCSGKTTTANKLISDFSAHGITVHVVSFDDFFKEHSELGTIVGSDGKERPDYDSVNAINIELLHDTLECIFRHEDVNIPIYDFEKGRVNGYKTLDLSPGNLVIFEGIQAVYPEIVALFSEHKYKSIYISVSGEIKIGDKVFTGRDLRFLRRVVRDYKFRGAEPDFSYYMWEGVCDNEDRNMVPYSGLCDIQVNSIMPYEPGIIKDELLSILSRVKPDGPYAERAKEVIECFSGISSISPEYLPPSSVYHEFIG